MLILFSLWKFVGPVLSKSFLWIGLAVLVIAGLWYFDPYRAAAKADQAQIAQDAANAAALSKRNDSIISQLEADAATAQAQAVHYALIKRNIADAPHTSNCAGSPAIRRALDGLRLPPASAATPAG